jgi:GT2 family glycosyltransferase
MSVRFSVIIVNFNGGAYVQGALTSLAAQTCRDFEVIVWDNASHDGSVDALDATGLPAYRLVRSEKNLGFAGGNNAAAALATGDWLALLNPDAAAAPGWLAAIEAGIARHAGRGVSMFASLQRAMHEAGKLDGVGDAFFGFGIPWRGGFGRPDTEVPGEGTCFSPCGAGAVYAADAFRAVGGFDERFFCFGEDTDIAFRLRARGGQCVFLPDAEIAHAGGALSGRVSEFALFHGSRNRVWTYVKNMPGWSLWLTLPGHLAITALILARGLMTGRARDTWRGIVAALKDLGPVQAQRREEARARSVPVSRLLAAMCWNPWRFFTRRPDVRPFS